MFTWDPNQYSRYGNLRLRPALDLMAHIVHPNPRHIYDVGTGRGEMARLMAERWTEAEVIGTDSSDEMLATAAATPSSVLWRREDVKDWGPSAPPDIVFSNAVLHWVPNHDPLLVRIVGSLAPGGVLGIQMPLSWLEPSHQLMREVLATGGPRGGTLGTEALRTRFARRPVADPGHYHEVLAPLVGAVDIWTTRYLQVLEGPDPVFEWVKGTALRPILESLEGEELQLFLDRYREELRLAYPQNSAGTTLFPFPRVFIVARR